MDFDTWLAGVLGESEDQVRLLLADRAAQQFLIAWSLFESKCLDGFAKFDKLEEFSDHLVAELFALGTIREATAHFHDRYQNHGHYRRLMHGHKDTRTNALLKRPLEGLTPADQVYLAAVVTFRFRNNIFHGNKGVPSWLAYKDQIALCTGVLQAFVSHAESRAPTLRMTA